jgi:hypothetical protein
MDGWRPKRTMGSAMREIRLDERLAGIPPNAYDVLAVRVPAPGCWRTRLRRSRVAADGSSFPPFHPVCDAGARTDMTLFHRRACASPVASFAPGVAMECWRARTKSQAKLEMAYLRCREEACCRLLEVMSIPQFPCTQPRSQAPSAIRRQLQLCSVCPN